MKKTVERLRKFVASLPMEKQAEGLEIVTDFDKWSAAMFSMETLNEMASAFQERIEDLRGTISYHQAISEVIKFASQKLGAESSIEINHEALDEIKALIPQLEEKLAMINKLRVLMEMDGMLY